jgi:hypothetical protein
MFEMNTAATKPRLIVVPVPTWIPRITLFYGDLDADQRSDGRIGAP